MMELPRNNLEPHITLLDADCRTPCHKPAAELALNSVKLLEIVGLWRSFAGNSAYHLVRTRVAGS
jgi:hypothetical protein